MGKHGTAFVWNIQYVAMALHALFVIEGVVGRLAVFGVIVFSSQEMDHHILNAVKGFGVEEVKGVMGRRQMAVHAVGDKSLGIVDVCRCLPGVVGEFDFMAAGAELGSGGSHHGVVAHAKEWKAYENTQPDKGCCKQVLFFHIEACF
jgi:hypothetical protein